MEYSLEKSVWTENDFEQMGWHDVSIYGMIIENDESKDYCTNLLFDIDYIFQWVHPTPPNQYFTFWIAPCTLVFKEVFDLTVDIDFRGSFVTQFEIEDILLVSKTEQSKNDFVYEWNLELQTGSICFKSKGFEQIVRKYPMHAQRQMLDIDQRGGISFSKDPYK